MGIYIIAAHSENNVIGKGLDIPWKVKGEQKLFKEITIGNILIFGRKTFDSIGKALPGRETFIITRDKNLHIEGCFVHHDLKSAIYEANKMGKDIFIAGGGEIYRQAIPLADGLHLTTIHTQVDGNIFFPQWNHDDFQLVKEQKFESNIDYTYQYYERR